MLSPGDIFFVDLRLIHCACRKSLGNIYAVVFDLNLRKISANESDPADVKTYMSYKNVLKF